MGKRILIFIVGVLSLTQSRAQSQLIIRGTVQDSAGALLSKATIRLWKGSDTIPLLSGTSGQFTASIPRGHGEWNILVTMQGFRTYHNYFTVPENTKLFTLPPILLQTEYQELQAVIIHKEHPLTIKVDTIEYNAGSYAMREGDMLEDLMKKLSGVTLNPDSSITIMGKKVAKLLVDGKEFFGGNMQIALENLPYDIIDKVQVIDDYGDQARLTGVRAGEPGKVLNIELKKDRRRGQLGGAEGGVGNKDHYKAMLTYNAFLDDRKFSISAMSANINPYGQENARSLDLSYVDSWGPHWSGSGDGNLTGRKYSFENGIIQDIHFAGGDSRQEQNGISKGTEQLQKLNYELLFTPNANTRFRVTTSFSQRQLSDMTQTNLSSTEADSGINKATQGTAINQSDTRTLIAESRIYFEQFFPHSKQRLSLDANLKYNSSLQNSDNLTNTSIWSDSLTNHTIQHYRLHDLTEGWDLGTVLHYYFPLGKDGFLGTRYSLHHTLTETNRTWQQPDSSGDQWNIVDSLSNKYTFQTTVLDFQTGYTRHLNKIDLDLGIVAEPGSLTGRSFGKEVSQSYSYFKVFPDGSFSYIFDRLRKLTLGYNTRITLPSPQQVQPVIDLSNPQYPVIGNPTLRPAANNSLALTYEQRSSQPSKYPGFWVGVAGTEIQNMIISDIVRSNDTSSVIQRTYFENVNGSYALNLNWWIQLPSILHKRLKISSGGALSKNRGISLEDHMRYSTDALDFSQNFIFQYNIPDRFDASVNIQYNQTLARYAQISNPPVNASALEWWMSNRHYFLRSWTLGYDIAQTFTSVAGSALSPNPLIVNAFLRRSFLKRKQLTGSLSVYNLSNSHAEIHQTAFNTIIVQNRTNLTGRIVLFTIQWKFEQFKKGIGTGAKNNLFR